MSDGYHYEDEVQRRAYDTHLMKRLLGYVKPYKVLIVMATILLLAASVLSNAVPLMNMRAINGPIQGKERAELVAQLEQAEGAEAERLEAALERQKAEDQSELNTFAIWIACFMGGEMLLRCVQLILVAYVGQKTMLTMRMQIFEHLQRMSLRFLDRHPVGRLMTRVTNDVETIQATIVTGMVQVISDLFTVVIVLGFMLWVNATLTLVTLLVLPFIFLTSLIFRRYARQTYFEIRRKIARVNAYMQENISGIRVVQLFNREDLNYKRYQELNASHRDEWFRQVRYYSVYFPVIDFLTSLAVALIILYGGYQIISGQELRFEVAYVGMFIAYVQWTERLFNPIKAIADRYNLLLEAMAASERIFYLLDTPEDLPNKLNAQPCESLKGEIRYDHVYFGYEPGNWVLEDINLHIEPGERIAIVGHTGAGKSTLTALLSRFYDVDEGRITIDGVDVRDYDKRRLRQRIGVVLQDVFLFSGTVEQNITLGDEAMSSEWVREAAEYVNAARFIERLPGGYQYQVGERGCNLSTGQRQLLAFARTLAHRPHILVLDEATSSVDTETEFLIQDAIHKLMEGRTSIVIAHRLSTVQHADRIVVMHHGRIREIGDHQELLELGGIYYTLYQLQYKDQMPAA